MSVSYPTPCYFYLRVPSSVSLSLRVFCPHIGPRDLSEQNNTREGVLRQAFTPRQQSSREKVQEDPHPRVGRGTYQGLGGGRRQQQVRSAPSQPWINQVLMHHSTLGRAYTQLIHSFSESAQDHINLADGLDAQVVNVLKLVEKRHEEAKKKVRAPNTTTPSAPDPVSASESVPKAPLR